MKKQLKTPLNSFWRIAGLAAITLFISLPLSAGNKDTKEINELIRELSDQLDEASTELADEYLDILDKLDGTIEDYTEYFDELDDNFLLENNLSFRVFLRKLKSEAYLDDPRQVQNDIRTYVSRLARLSGDHAHTGECRENCRMLTNLRRELSVLGEHVDDYLSTQTRKQLRQKEMLAYLRAALSRIIDRRDRVGPLAPSVHSEPEERRITIGITLGSTPSSYTVPGAPEIESSEAPDNVSHSNRAFFDSLKVNDRIRQIRVTNPAGDLRITGWQKPMISASLRIEVASLSKTQENSFLDNSYLLVDTLGGDYVVSVSFPTLDNMKTRLTKSSLVIRVPFQMKLSAGSSFGQISIADIQADVNVKGQHSEINVDNIVGATEVINSSGTIRLTEIRGEIFTRSSYGAIELTNCKGTIQAENKYSDLRMYDCGGSAALRGSGNVFVQGFVGPLDISNSYGRVEVRDVDGTLEATNAYDALIVRDITGNTTLENSYAKISAYKIGGRLSISNSNGIIFAEGMEGPMSIENEAGDIKIVLDRSLGGNSTIINRGGAIDVAFLRRGDFVLSASTLLGKINSHLPLYIENNGDTKSTAVTFGRGLDSVLLVGTNSVINISESN